jgi:hypothetical protein
LGSLRLAAISAGAKYQDRPIAKATRNIVVCTIPPGIRQRSVVFWRQREYTASFCSKLQPGQIQALCRVLPPRSTGNPARARRFVRISASSLRHGPAPTPRASKPTPSMRTLVLPWPARKALSARRQARVDLEQALLRANGSLRRYPPPSKCHSRILPTQCRRFQERIEA